MAKKEENKGLEKTTEAVKRETGKPSFMKRVKKWLREMKSELKKVVWPTRKQITNNSIVALVVMAASAVVVWGFDQVATAVVNTLISIVG